MKFIFPLSLLFFLVGCADQPAERSRSLQQEDLMSEEQTIELTYIAWGCDCANWATPEDMEKFAGSDSDSLAERCIFLEAAAESLEFPDTMDYNGDRIRFTGRFYNEKGFPEGYKSDEPVDEARVFRYTSWKLIKEYHDQ
jgi:hypothetical protein